jgi:hypothetical protein
MLLVPMEGQLARAFFCARYLQRLASGLTCHPRTAEGFVTEPVGEPDAIGTSGSMSGDGKRSVGHRPQATALILDSTRPD